MLLPFDKIAHIARAPYIPFVQYLAGQGAIGPYAAWAAEVQRLSAALVMDHTILWFQAVYETDGFTNASWLRGDTFGGLIADLRQTMPDWDTPEFGIASAQAHVALWMALMGYRRYHHIVGEGRWGWATDDVSRLIHRRIVDTNRPTVLRMDDLCLRYPDEHGNLTAPLSVDRGYARAICMRAMASGVPIASQRYLKRLDWAMPGFEQIAYMSRDDHIYEGPSRANNQRMDIAPAGKRLRIIGRTSGHAPDGHHIWHMVADPVGGFVNSGSVQFA